MSELELWLQRATRELARDSASKVRREIDEHYQSARESALAKGVTKEEADRMALVDLGDAQAVNCQYKKVMLTSAEASLLRSGSQEAQAVCSRKWLKWPLRGIVATALVTSVLTYLSGAMDMARLSLAFTMAAALLLAMITLQINTAVRGRAFRAVKWAAMLAIMALAFGPQLGKQWLLLTTCLWPLVWIEIARASIRRKLPLSTWPRQLFY
jgi:hypothetical protein